jgi:hypothetical protein
MQQAELMSRRFRVLALALVLGALPLASPAHAAGPKPGLSGAVLTLDSVEDFKGYDVAVDPGSGISYVGWIAQNTVAGVVSRTVKLCVLPLGAVQCAGGVMSTDGLGSSSANGLHVVLEGTDQPVLVWFHDTTPGSVNGPRGGRVAISRPANGALTAGVDIHDAASFGQLFDAEVVPQGGSGKAIWTVTAKGAVPTEIEVGTATARQTVTSPVGLDAVRLSFDYNRTQQWTPVMAAVKYGSVSDPVLVTYQPALGAPWPAFAGLAGTSAPSAGLTWASTTTRLITSAPGATGQIVSVNYDGSSWKKPVANGYRYRCPDLGMDVEGQNARVAYVAYHCSDLVVGNFEQGGTRSAVVTFPSGGTVTYHPAISGTWGGQERVVWSIQREGGNPGHLLKVAAVLLPTVPNSTTAKGKAGKVTLTLPLTCWPPVAGQVKASAKAAKGWKLTKLTVKRDGKKIANPSSIDGSAFGNKGGLQATATGTFTRAGVTKRVTAKATVLRCPSP